MEGERLIAVANRNRLGVQAAQKGAILRQEFDVAALRALQHNVTACRPIGQKRKLGEHVAVEFVMASQALNTSGAACRLFLDGGGFRSADFFDTHANFPSTDSTVA